MAKKRKKKRSGRRAAPALEQGTAVDWAVDPGGRLVAVDEVEHRLVVEQEDGTFRFVGSRGASPGQFLYPRGVAILGDRAWVVDCWNHRVQAFDLPSWEVVGEFGGLGEGAGQLFCPSSIAVVLREGQEPCLAIADTNNRRIVFHDTAGKYLFAAELFRPGYPRKARFEGGVLMVRYEDGVWEPL